MVLVKILGGIDLLAAFAFLMLTFGLAPFAPFLLFCAAFLLLKGLFIFTGEIVLSLVDLFSAILLILSIFFAIPVILLWIAAFLLIAKGVVSFI